MVIYHTKDMLMVTHDINNEERNKTSVQENNTSLFDKELQILEMKWVNSVQTDYKRINYKRMRQYCIRLKWNTDMGYDSAVNAADGVGERMIIRKSNNNFYKLYAALLEDEKKAVCLRLPFLLLKLYQIFLLIVTHQHS